jgi:ribosomal protein S18 acetylase RimI-like enzyme
MNSRVAASFLFFSLTIPAQPIIMPFSYATDIKPVEALIKKEWRRLFWMSEYDQALITTIFKNQHPGDPAARAQQLFISVLKEHGGLRGFITYYYSSAQTGHIELLCVDPEYQGSGYGKKLVSHVEHFFAANNCTLLQLYVYTSNPHAIEFYKHRGFTVKKQNPGYLLLSKELKKEH